MITEDQTLKPDFVLCIRSPLRRGILVIKYVIKRKTQAFITVCFFFIVSKQDFRITLKGLQRLRSLVCFITVCLTLFIIHSFIIIIFQSWVLFLIEIPTYQKRIITNRVHVLANFIQNVRDISVFRINSNSGKSGWTKI